MAHDEVIITETTVGNINGVSISCGNIYKRQREGPDGKKQKEMSVTFRTNVNELNTLFLNSQLDFNGETWEVAEFINGEMEGRSKVKMRKVD